MKLTVLLLSFVLFGHVRAQLTNYIYEEEEDDEEGGTTTRPTSTTPKPTTEESSPGGVVNVVALGNLTNATGPSQNYTFYLMPANGSIFGSVLSLSNNNAETAGGTTERVQHVLSQVGGIWNSVGSLNITGIVDQALGIRNSQLARPLVTGILNVVLCNPITYSENNCNKKGWGVIF